MIEIVNLSEETKSDFMVIPNNLTDNEIVDREKFIEFLVDGNYYLVKALYKNAPQNKQGYQYVFYNGERYAQFFRQGGSPSAKEQISVNMTQPPVEKSFDFASFDFVHDILKEPERLPHYWVRQFFMW